MRDTVATYRAYWKTLGYTGDYVPAALREREPETQQPEPEPVVTICLERADGTWVEVPPATVEDDV